MVKKAVGRKGENSNKNKMTDINVEIQSIDLLLISI